VTHNLSDEGMGIGFVQVEAKDQAVLEEWLAEHCMPQSPEKK
jgi:hypothetical protein